MARFLKPLVRSGGYYPSRRWTPLVYPGGYTTANGGEEPAPPPIEKTIIGNPIHILDALAKPAQALSVKLEPVQDLHGYSYPWPSGGGKNKFNGTFLQGYWAYASGWWTNSNTWITTEKIPCKASTSYTVSSDAKLTRWQGFVWYDSNGNYISTDNLQSNENIGLTRTSPSNAGYLVFNIAGYPTSSDPISPSDVTHFQIEEGQTATSYATYSNICPISGYSEAKVYVSPTQDAQDATVYTIDLDGVRYGGTLDVTTGKLTVTMAMVDLGTKNWYPLTAAGRTRFRTSITDIERISSPNIVAPMLCSAYKTETANNTYTGKQGISLQQNAADVYVYDPQTESMTTAEFKSAMSGVQLVYKLATPIVYDLTPTQIELFAGENNIWSDGEMTLTYLADGNASDEEALNILLGGRYVNNHGEDEPTDREALNIILGENER